MKKFYFLLTSLALFLGASTIGAETQSPYSVDFNNTISTTDHDFKVATGWGHIVGSAYLNWENVYVQYTYSTSAGVDNSGALRIGSQTVESDDYEYGDVSQEEVKDYLVTPAVSGNVTIKAKKYSNSHYLQVYKATKNTDGSFTVGDTLSLSNGTFSSKSYDALLGDEYTTLTIGNFAEPTYLAIRGNQVYIDDFYAENADVELTRSLKITNENAVISSPDTREDGTYPVKLALELTNTGDYDLAPGDADYTVTVYEKSSGTEIGTAPLTKTLLHGESGNDTITVYAKYADFPKYTGYKVRENVSGTSYKYQAWVQPTAYEAIMNVRTEGSYNDLSDGTQIAFGKINKNVSKNLVILSKGAKPVEISSITVPEGFTVNKETPLTIAAHSSDTLTVTALASEPGIHNGNLVIEAPGADTLSLALSATVLDSSKYYITFEDNKWPAGTMQESNNWSIYECNLDGNKYLLQNSLIDETKFITPLLKVNEGESIQFDAGKRSNYSFVNVYYSADRKNWTRVDSIGVSQMSDESSESQDLSYALSTFTVTGIPAGNYYIAFGSGYANIDNIYGFQLVPVTHDAVVKDAKLSSSAHVNSAYEASASLLNINSKAEAAGNYTATLHFGDETVSAEPVEIASMDSKSFNFSLTPHKAGSVKAFILFDFGDGYTASSDTVDVQVAEETANKEVQVGTVSTVQSNSPLNLSYYNSETQTVYDADLLSGLKKGDKITSISYKGYNVNGAINSTLNIWMQNTTAAPVGQNGSFTAANTDTLTSIYSGTYTFPVVGDKDSHESIITINLAKPLVYDGNNLLVVVRSENADNWKNVSFETTSEQDHTYGRYKDNHDSFLTASFSSMATPVVYFGVEKNANTVSGTVKDTLGTAIAGAAVKLYSGDVEYSGETDAEGRYTVKVMKDDLNYTLFASATDFTPYVEKNIKVDAPLTKDIVLKPATGLFISDYSLPKSGSVNSEVKASVKLTNVISSSIAASEYSAEVVLDGKTVAKSNGTEDIASGKDAELSFAFTPHKAGTLPLYIKATYGSNEYLTSTDSIVIAPENFGGEFVAGDSTGINNGGSPQTPWNNWYKQSQSVIVYTPAQLGLEKGSKITNIRFRGSLANYAAGKEATSLYIGNASSVPSSHDEATALLNDTTSMTRILTMQNDSIDYNGSSAGDAVVDFINVDIPGGFTYNGGNIVVVFDGNHFGSSDNKISTVVDNTVSGQAWGRTVDSGDINTQTFVAQSSLPVMYMTVVNRKTLSGTVFNRKSHAPVADADVMLKSGGVEYTAKTDASGNYSMDIAKASLIYDAIFSAEGFIADTIKTVTLSDGDVTVLNDTLAPIPVKISLTGTVKGLRLHADEEIDPYAGEILKGATVAVSDADGKNIATTTTSDDGTYSVDSLTEGNSYKIVFSADGYNSQEIDLTAADTNMVVNTTLYMTKKAVDLSGTVTGLAENATSSDNATALAGATVKVTDGNNIVATATTDSEGKYTVRNLIEGTEYTVTFSANGYYDSTKTVTAGADNFTLDVSLKAIPTGIDVLNANNSANDGIAHGNVYSIGGQLIGSNIEIKSLPRGVYIINGKKQIVK